MEVPMIDVDENVEVVAKDLEGPLIIDAEPKTKLQIEEEDSVVLIGTGDDDDDEEQEGHATVVPVMDDEVPKVVIEDRSVSAVRVKQNPIAEHSDLVDDHEQVIVKVEDAPLDDRQNVGVENNVIISATDETLETKHRTSLVSGQTTDLDPAGGLEATEKEIEKMWAGRSNVMVAVRCRPMSKRELARSHKVVYVMDGSLVAVVDNQTPAGKKGKEDVLRQGRSREKRYAFDHAFGPEVRTQQVYEHTTKLLIDGVIIGYNATVFAYGPTGAGKTFTMLGGAASAAEAGQSLPPPLPPPALHPQGQQPAASAASNELGIMVLTMRDLFSKVKYFQRCSRNTRNYKISCSFLEVYNEMIRDLLTPSSEYLDLREDPVKGPIVAGLSEVEASTADDVMRLLRKGNARRSTEGTGANEASSRSHAVLQITVEQVDDGRSGGAMANVTIGKLSLIDLAGSERASATQSRGLRQKEGANINKSLLALGNCINALREGGRGTFVPYRDSKLTRLLKDSLGGNCRTVMIAAVSPSSNQQDETLNTLKYANRAKNIKTKVERNVLNVDYHVTEYVNLIARLKSEITSLRNKLKKPSLATGSGLSNEMLAQRLLSGAKLSSAEQQQLLSSRGTAGDPFTVTGADGSSAEKRRTVEKRQMALLREQLVLNFKERMQLRRSLIEIEAQNIANKTELEMHQLAIQQWETGLEPNAKTNSNFVSHSKRDNVESIPVHNSGSVAETIVGADEEHENDFTRPNSVELKYQQQTKSSSQGTSNDSATRKEPEWVRVAREESAQLQRANMNNSNLKHDIEKRLKENQEQAEALRKQMDTRITTEERRELMELEYRIGMLELENMELERSRMLHKSSMAHKDTLIQRLLWQLQLRDNVISEQKKLLESTGVTEEKVGDAVEEFTMEIEPLKMLESLPKGTPITPVTPHRSHQGADFLGRIAKLRQAPFGFTDDSEDQLGKSKDSASLPKKPQVFPLHRLEEELQRIEQGQGATTKSKRRAHPSVPRPHGSVAAANNNNVHDNQSAAIHQGTSGKVAPGPNSSSHPNLKAGANAPSHRNRKGTRSSAAERERRKYMHNIVNQRKPHPYLRHQGPHRSSKRSTKQRHSRSHHHTVQTRHHEDGHQTNLPVATVLESPQSRKNKSRHRSRNSERWLEKMANYLNSPRTPSGAIAVPPSAAISGSKHAGSPSSFQQQSKSSHRQSAQGREGSVSPKESVSNLSATDGPMEAGQSPTSSGAPARGRKHRLHTVAPQPSTVQEPARPQVLAGAETDSSVARATNVSLPPIPSSKDLRQDLKEHDGSSGSEDAGGLGIAFPKSSAGEPGSRWPGRPNSGSSIRSGGGNEPGATGRAVAVPPVHQAGTRRRYGGTSHPRQQAPQQGRKPGTNNRNSRSLSPKRGDPLQASTKERRTSALSRLNHKIASHMTTAKEDGLRAQSKGLSSSPKAAGGEGKQGSPREVNKEDAGVATSNQPATGKAAGAEEPTKEGKLEEESATPKHERKQRRKLERKWAELEFVLRKPIQNDKDIEAIRRATVQSLQFLDQLDSKAAELNVLRGTLSRMLLPYHENTAAATQRASTPVMGDSPLDSVMDLATRKHMVNCANELRSLVRVKIADDADLDQARTAVCETKMFFDKLADYATKKSLEPYAVLRQL